MSTAAIFEPPVAAPAIDPACPFPGRSSHVTLPYPPSINHFWMTGKGMTFISPDGRKYKENAALTARAAGIRPFSGPVAVAIDIFRPRKSGDLDNLLKVLLDSLKGIAFDDDRQVVQIFARRFDDKDNPRAEISIRSSNLAGTQNALEWEGA